MLPLLACAPDDDTRTSTPEAPEVTDVVGLANWDDDDADGVADWDDTDGVDGEDDYVRVPLHGATRVAVSGGALRVWETSILIDANCTGCEAEVDGESIEIEFGESNFRGTLTLDGEDRLLQSAPLILNHHLQDVEWVASLETNDEFVEGFADELDIYEDFSLREYDWDVWLEDEIELAWMTVPDRRMDVVIDSIRSQRDQYLDDLPENELFGPDFASRTWGSGRATSQDSFGNLEITPPIDGYPYGRIYWGDWRGNDGPTDDLRAMLEAQEVQAPFVLDVGWLCVGHVDEFLSFVPDSTAPRGFRLMLADTDLGFEFIDDQDPTLALTRFGQDHGYDTVADLAADEDLRVYNEEIQVESIDAALAVLRAEVGITDDELIYVPAIFEESNQCGGKALSLIPGTTNLVVAPVDGTTHIFAADPFFRTDEDDPSSDPFIAAVEPLFPDELIVHWLDDWDWYHIAWGEVHCGSNTRRTPAADWWNVLEDP